MKCLTAALGSLLVWTNAFAQDEPRVPYPSEYRVWAVVTTKLVGPQSKFFAARGGFHHFYANDKALEGYRTGVFPMER